VSNEAKLFGADNEVTAAILNNLAYGVITLDSESRITFWSVGAANIYGYTEAQALGQRCWALLRPLETDQDHDGDSGIDGSFQRHLTSTDEVIHIEVVESSVRIEEDPGSVLIVREVDARSRLQARVQHADLLARAAWDASPMMNAICDQNARIISASRAWQDWARHCSQPERLESLLEWMLPADRAQHFLERFHRVLAGEVPRIHHDYEVTVSGERRSISAHMSRIPGVGVSLTVADITERARRTAELAFEATHDPLTRLPNRSLLVDRIEQALDRQRRLGGHVGVILCDLDNFKIINDRHGHAAGDQVLLAFASRLQAACRSSDTVARLHGDEFAILVEDSGDLPEAEAIADRVVAAASEPIRAGVHAVSVGASVGCVVSEPGQAGTAQELLHKADAAMYEAKNRGKGQWVCYNDTLADGAVAEAEIQGAARGGRREGQFELHYQPQFSRRGMLVGAEALLRWRDPNRGVTEPIDALQRLGGLPIEMGDWLLGQAAANLAFWEPWLPDQFTMTVNLARSQWLDHETPVVALDWLERNRLTPQRLQLQVSQEILSIDPDSSRRMTHELRTAGIRVSVNGFAIGPGPLFEVAGIDVDTAVLSPRVIRQCEQDRGRFLRACRLFAQTMGWTVVAVGVETENQWRLCRDAGIEIGQGYWFEGPLTDEKFLQRHLHGTDSRVERGLDG